MADKLPFNSDHKKADFTDNPRHHMVGDFVVKSNPSVELLSGENMYSPERLLKTKELLREYSTYGIKAPEFSFVQGEGGSIEYWGEPADVKSFTLYKKIDGTPMEDAIKAGIPDAVEAFDKTVAATAKYIADKYKSDTPTEYLDDFYAHQFVFGQPSGTHEKPEPYWVDSDPAFRRLSTKEERTADELVDFGIAASLVVDMATETMRNSGKDMPEARARIEDFLRYLTDDSDPRSRYIASKIAPGLETGEMIKIPEVDSWLEDMRNMHPDPIEQK